MLQQSASLQQHDATYRANLEVTPHSLVRCVSKVLRRHNDGISGFSLEVMSRHQSASVLPCHGPP